MIARFGIALTAALLISAAPAWSQAASSKDCPPGQTATTGSASSGATSTSKDTIRSEPTRKDQSAILPSAGGHTDSKAPTIPDAQSAASNDCEPASTTK